MKRLPQPEITEALRLHQLYRDTDGREGARADFSGCDLRGLNLGGAYLVRANLVRANLGRAYLVRANLDGAYLGGANLGDANLDGANLGSAYLGGAYLGGANLVRAYLGGANLGSAYLVRANLGGAYLDGAYLDGANLGGAYLVRANLGGANLGGANLGGAYLDGANLDGANLDGANLGDANLDGARGFQPFVCVGPIGSRHGTTTAYLLEDRIQCGCFSGTLDQFEAKVRQTHKDNPLHLAEYLALVAMVRALREAQPTREEIPEPPAPFSEGDRVQLTEDGTKQWPWAPSGVGEVCWCRGGWTRVEFDDCYLSFLDGFIRAAAAP